MIECSCDEFRITVLIAVNGKRDHTEPEATKDKEADDIGTESVGGGTILKMLGGSLTLVGSITESVSVLTHRG